MINRREFLGYSGLAALASAIPALAAEKERIAPRLIPGTDEGLPVIGLGNSGSFRDSDLTAAADLLDIFFEHGGGYVDVGGVSRMSVGTIAKSRNASDKLFLGNYLEPKSAAAMRAEAANVAEGQGKDALDLVHTRNLAGYRENHSLYRQMKEEGLVRYIGIARSGAQSFAAIEQLIKDGLVDVIQVNPTTGAETYAKAEILRAQAREALLRVDGRIRLMDVRRIAFKTLPAGLRARPTLVLTLEDNGAGEGAAEALTLRYLTGGLNWRANYVAALNADETSDTSPAYSV